MAIWYGPVVDSMELLPLTSVRLSADSWPALESSLLEQSLRLVPRHSVGANLANKRRSHVFQAERPGLGTLPVVSRGPVDLIRRPASPQLAAAIDRSWRPSLDIWPLS